jgi:hypothetical protein
VAVPFNAAIHGRVNSYGCSTTGVCNWNISYTVNGGSVHAINTAAIATPMDFAQMGVFEVYNVSFCNQMPNNGTPGGMTFTNTFLYMPTATNANGRREVATTQPWTNYTDTTVSPNCNFGAISWAPRTASLYWQWSP